MQLREINLGCFGGGTGLPSLLGGLKRNPWLRLNAVVTMFDSGGSSGQLRDELGVLPPGDVLRCALALSRNEGEARRVLLARLPTLEHARLGGHTAGNLLLSMMERYGGDFLSAVDALRALLGCRGSVWPISVEQATLCAEFADGTVVRGGEVEVDQGHARGHHVTRVWLEPPALIHPAVRNAITQFDAVVIGPGSFFTSLMPTLLVTGVADVLAAVKGPIVVVSNLLTEGQGMRGFSAADEVAWISKTIGRKIDVLIANNGQPSPEALDRYAAENKHPLPIGTIADGTEAVVGDFWRTDMARHDRQRLSYAVWSVLSQRLLA
ncbi:MAG TPA: gluconeogenesis factor YvcK family protein [Vicinamibacterales bacterium]|nr:gluconeogenesis factor YvcK family protein [Vicinamibacterales bacterium]